MARPKNSFTEITSGRTQKPTAKPFDLEPLDKVPEAESYMKEYQRKFFIDVCTALVDAKQLRSIDVCNVEIAGFWFQIARDAMDKMQEGSYYQTTQTGYEQITPHITALERATKMLQSFADRYGLNLTSKSKVPRAKTDKNSLSSMFEPKR